MDLGLAVARSYGLTFRLPDDLERVYADDLGVDLVRFNGDTSWELPVPAVFVVDGEGIVRYAAGDPDYTARPEPDEWMEVVRGL